MLVQLALPRGQVAMGMLTVHHWSDRPGPGLDESPAGGPAVLFERYLHAVSSWWLHHSP